MYDARVPHTQAGNPRGGSSPGCRGFEGGSLPMCRVFGAQQRPKGHRSFFFLHRVVVVTIRLLLQPTNFSMFGLAYVHACSRRMCLLGFVHVHFYRRQRPFAQTSIYVCATFLIVCAHSDFSYGSGTTGVISNSVKKHLLSIFHLFLAMAIF